MMKDELIRQIRLVQTASGKRTRYTKTLRVSVVQHVRAQRAAKVSWADIGKEFGIVPSLLQRWNNAAQSNLVPIKIAPVPSTAAPSQKAFVIHGPRGLRIDGLSVSELAELLTRLSA